MSSLPTPPRLGPSLSSSPPPPDAMRESEGAPAGLHPGDLLDGCYRIEAQIGEGGVGAVYRALQVKLHRRVAVKLLLQDVIGEEELRPRFEQEALTLAALSHPHIVMMQDYGLANGRPYLVMELLEGRTLREILDSEGALDPARALALIRQLVLALAYAHELGIVHRDLKPANLIVQAFPAYEHVKVLDFGMVKLMPGSYLDRGAQLTRIGFTFGTPAYMSPEHALGGEVDGRSDLYSVGVLLFEMLTGKKPYEGEVHDILRHHLASPVPSLAEFQPALSELPELQRLVEQAMAKEREGRFADASDLLRVIDELLMSGLLADEEDSEPEASAAARSSFVPRLRETLESASAALSSLARVSRETWEGQASPQLQRARRELRALGARLAPKLRGLSRATWSRLLPPLASAARRVQRIALEARARVERRPRALPASLEADATIVDEPRFPEHDEHANGAHQQDSPQADRAEHPESASDTADPLVLEPRTSKHPEQ